MSLNGQTGPAWSAFYLEAPTLGGRDLLGLGEIGEALSQVLAPNIRATSWRARYFSLLTLAVHLMPEGTEAAEERRGWVFDFEKSWLLAVSGYYLEAAGDDEARATQRLANVERGLLGRGRGRIVSPTIRAARELLSANRIKLDRFAPLQAPQTSGMYGRYVGAARSSALLAEGRTLALGNFGPPVAESALRSAEIGKTGQFTRDVEETLGGGTFERGRYAAKRLATLRLGNIRDASAKSERAALTAALLESNESTRTTAAVLRRALPKRDGSITEAVIVRMSKSLPDSAVTTAVRSVLDELPGFDRARRALDAVYSSVAAHTNELVGTTGEYNFPRGKLTRTSVVKEATKGFANALSAVRSSCHPALLPLRNVIERRKSGKSIDSLGLLSDLHEATMKRRGMPRWFEVDEKELRLDRPLESAGPPGGATGPDEEAIIADLGRYRLGALRSLIADLGWKGKP